MSTSRSIFLFIFTVWLSFNAAAQVSDITKKNHRGKKYTNIKFRKNRKMAIICPIFVVSEYPYQGIGIKVGDPTAITYKFYATEKLAFGLEFGRAASGLYRDLHRDRFETSPVYQDSIYISHNVLSQNVFSASVYYYKEGPRAIKGLDLYIGVGWQVQFADVRYEYLIRDESVPGGAILNGDDSPVVFSFQPMGPQATFGLEYAYFSIPISAFVEGGVFYGFDEAQTWLRFQGGVGIRYVF